MQLLLTILYSTLAICLPTLNLLPEKLSLKQTIAFFLTFYFSSFASAFYGNIGLFVMLFCIMLFFLLLPHKKLINICCFLAGYIICIVIDNIICPVYLTVLNTDIETLKNERFHYFIFSLLVIMTGYMLSFILGSFFKKNVYRKNRLTIPSRYSFLIFINLIICVLIFAFNIIMGEKAGYTFDILLFNCVIFIVYFIVSTATVIISMQSYISKTEAAMRQRSYEALQDYTARMETMYADLRSFKHDYINIMSSMSGYIETRDLNGLEQYFTEKIVPLRKDIDQNNRSLE